MTEWRDIPGFEGLYQISSDGQVRSLTRRAKNGPRAQSEYRLVRERLLKRQPSSATGHLNVVLYRDGERRTFKVHRLVAQAFKAHSWFPGAQVCHNDGNPSNNTVDNLRWGTAADNAQDKMRHGRHFHANRTHCVNGHLYDELNTAPGGRGNERVCRACNREKSRRHRERKRVVA